MSLTISNPATWTIEEPLIDKTSLPCYIVHNFFRSEQCLEMINKANKIGFDLATHDYPPSYRNNERIIMDNDDLAFEMTEKVKSVANQLKLLDFEKDGYHCILKTVNPRFRLCRYQPGQEFRIHQDGVHYKSKTTKSILTFMIYLNEEFEDGHTIFFNSGPSNNPPPIEWYRYKPKCGDLIIFDHTLWHSGEIVNGGIKYVMRSDIIYDTTTTLNNPSDDESNHLNNISHNGYVWKMIKVGGGADQENTLIASGGRDTTINIFNSQSLNLLFQFQGHSKSVLGLSKMGNDQLVSISRDRSIKIWSLSQRKCIHTFPQAHTHTGLCVESVPSSGSGTNSTSQHMIASGGADCLIKIWKFENENFELYRELHGHQGWVWSLSWVTIPGFSSRDIKYLVSASEDGSIRIWNVGESAGRTSLVLDQLQHPLRCLDTLNMSGTNSDDDMVTHISVGDTEGNLILYTISIGLLSRFDESTNNSLAYSKRTEFKNLHKTSIRTAHFINSELLLTGSEDFSVRLWKVTNIDSTPSLSLLYTGHHDNFVTDCLPLDNLPPQSINESTNEDDLQGYTSFLSCSYDGVIKKNQVALLPSVD